MSELPNTEVFDYVVQRGQVYQVGRNEYDGKTLLVEVDEIPQEYWERWDQ